MRDVIVLGAGLQGVCAALALANAGRRVTLLDREPGPLLRASLHNEGKIHLGFVYANDPTARTSSLMLDAALSFAPLLDRWCGGPLPWDRLAGRPFTYLILRDTLVPAEQIVEAWGRLAATFASREQAASTSYLGTSPQRLWSFASGADAVRGLVSDRVTHVAHTAELALDTALFRQLLATTLCETGRIECRFGHRVRSVDRVGGGFRVGGLTRDGESWRLRGAAVVNCLWEGRLALDRQMGLLPTRPWVYRLKCRLLGQLPPRLRELPSITMMCGRFGDVVNFGRGRAYLSWYPACLRGWSADVEVPPEWEALASGTPPPGVGEAIVAESLEAFDQVVPGLGESRIDSVAAGVIFSWGQTDIDDLSSELHRRDDIGPEAQDRYVTVNTGKLTSAPLFAGRIVELLD